jgi:prepilin-type N-terminal cleavage/methylation domain-containing protein
MQLMWKKSSSGDVSRGSYGFTLIELLLSVGMIGVLAGIGLPVMARSLTKNDLDTAVVSLVGSWRRGAGLAMANDGDSLWGVKVAAGSITLFKGNSFSGRDSSYDESFSLPSTISVSGSATEITFSKLTGTASAAGTVTLSNFADSKSLTINSQGTVEY